MRIITGSARGINLKTLEGEDTRPTPERVKEAVFSYIQFDIAGKTVLDLFAGSGQMGLEALSRGAEKATLVDASRDAANIITENAKKTKLYPKTNVLCMDWKAYIRAAGGRSSFDYIYLDPPYAMRLLPEILAALCDADMINTGGMVICEDEKPLDIEENVMLAARYEKVKGVKYGRVHITYLKPKAGE